MPYPRRFLMTGANVTTVTLVSLISSLFALRREGWIVTASQTSGLRGALSASGSLTSVTSVTATAITTLIGLCSNTPKHLGNRGFWHVLRAAVTVRVTDRMPAPHTEQYCDKLCEPQRHDFVVFFSLLGLLQ